MADPHAEQPWRLFVAVPIGEELRDALATLVGSLRAPAGDGWRWTEPEGWHMTLAFLGATQPARLPSLADALTRAADTEPFSAAGSGLGAFPSRVRARVLWYGFADPDGRLRRLARSVQDAVGLEADARFRAHLTLARARDRSGTDATALLEAADAPTGTIRVDRLVLYRSHLGRRPARYQPVVTQPLLGVA